MSDAEEQDAARAGLVYSTDREPGITRVRRGRGWSFHDPSGALITDGSVRERCLKLAIPPAYTDVWICPDPSGHLQATGRDAEGRKTYRYHDDWQTFRDRKKFHELSGFGRALGKAREANDEARHGTEPRLRRILSAVFWLLDAHALRVGNRAYASRNGSFGATTLRHRHFDDDDHALVFPGKSGQRRDVSLSDRRFLRLAEELEDLPGQHLFQYRDEAGALHPVSSSEVNAYLAGLFGTDVTAKNFRTWHGSVAAFTAGLEEEALVDDVLGAAAERLGNTKAIARTSYVHPRIVEEVKDGTLPASAAALKGGPARKGLSSEETWFLRWLER